MDENISKGTKDMLERFGSFHRENSPYNGEGKAGAFPIIIVK